MVYYLPTAFVFLFESFISFFIFSQVAKMKTGALKTAAGALLLFSVYYAVFVTVYNVYLNTFMCFIVSFIFAKLFFTISTRRAAITSFAIMVYMVLSEFLTMNLLALMDDSDISVYMQDKFHYIIFSVLSKSIDFIVCFSIVLVSRRLKLKDMPNDTVPFHIFLYPLSSAFIVLVFWTISLNNTFSERDKTLILLSAFLSAAATVVSFVFYFIASKNKTELAELQIAMGKTEVEKEYYKLLDYQQEELKKIVHDEKNHLQTIRSISNDVEINNYIDSVFADLSRHELKSWTDNKFLDSVVNKYSLQCEMQGINFIVNIKTANLSFMDNADITILVSNLMDNAVAAAQTSEKRRVELNINSALGHTAITCVNSCDNKPALKNNELVTSKENPAFHGYGIKNIKNTVKKYKGDYTWKYDPEAKEFISIISI